jgi:hypothetical protein
MTEESGSRGYRPQLRADPVVERLAPEQAPHETGVPLTGFLGPAGVEGRWRLYASRAFDDYVEFDESDVIDSETSDDSSAGSTIWLKAGASVKHTRVSSRQVQASFLSGETTRTFLPQADQSSLGVALARAGTGYACTRNYVCSTNPHIPACQLRTEVCGSLDCSPTGALCPSGEFTVC